jgi:hypothetical protein
MESRVFGKIFQYNKERKEERLKKDYVERENKLRVRGRIFLDWRKKSKLSKVLKNLCYHTKVLKRKFFLNWLQSKAVIATFQIDLIKKNTHIKK